MADEDEPTLRYTMRRSAVYFDMQDEVSGIALYVTDDVLEQVRSILDGQDLDVHWGILRLSVPQAMKLAETAGGWDSKTSPNYAVTAEIHDVLVYNFFNIFWDEGLAGALAGEDSY